MNFGFGGFPFGFGGFDGSCLFIKYLYYQAQLYLKYR